MRKFSFGKPCSDGRPSSEKPATDSIPGGPCAAGSRCHGAPRNSSTTCGRSSWSRSTRDYGAVRFCSSSGKISISMASGLRSAAPSLRTVRRETHPVECRGGRHPASMAPVPQPSRVVGAGVPRFGRRRSAAHRQGLAIVDGDRGHRKLPISRSAASFCEPAGSVGYRPQHGARALGPRGHHDGASLRAHVTGSSGDGGGEGGADSRTGAERVDTAAGLRGGRRIVRGSLMPG